MCEHGLAIKSAFLALKTYAQSCITHLQRANYENQAWISDLEDLFFQALGNILAWEGGSPEQLSAERRLIAAMTTKEGGLAFGGLPSRSASAFIGSWAMCLADVAKNLQVDSIAGFRARCPSIAHRMDAAEAAAKNNGCFGIRGSMNWQGVLDEAKPKVQSMLGDQIAKANGKKCEVSLMTKALRISTPMGGRVLEPSCCHRLLTQKRRQSLQLTSKFFSGIACCYLCATQGLPAATAGLTAVFAGSLLTAGGSMPGSAKSKVSLKVGTMPCVT